jgi:hypothetical protein
MFWGADVRLKENSKVQKLVGRLFHYGPPAKKKKKKKLRQEDQKFEACLGHANHVSNKQNILLWAGGMAQAHLTSTELEFKPQ